MKRPGPGCCTGPPSGGLAARRAPGSSCARPWRRSNAWEPPPTWARPASSWPSPGTCRAGSHRAKPRCCDWSRPAGPTARRQAGDRRAHRGPPRPEHLRQARSPVAGGRDGLRLRARLETCHPSYRESVLLRTHIIEHGGIVHSRFAVSELYLKEGHARTYLLSLSSIATSDTTVTTISMAACGGIGPRQPSPQVAPTLREGASPIPSRTERSPFVKPCVSRVFLTRQYSLVQMMVWLCRLEMRSRQCSREG